MAILMLLMCLTVKVGCLDHHMAVNRSTSDEIYIPGLSCGHIGARSHTSSKSDGHCVCDKHRFGYTLMSGYPASVKATCSAPYHECSVSLTNYYSFTYLLTKESETIPIIYNTASRCTDIDHVRVWNMVTDRDSHWTKLPKSALMFFTLNLKENNPTSISFTDLSMILSTLCYKNRLTCPTAF